MPLAPRRGRRIDKTFGGGELGDVGDRLHRGRLLHSSETRRPLLTAIGVFVVAGCAVLGAGLAAHVTQRSPYLAMATFVPQGSLITPSDVTVVRLAGGSGLAAVPAADSTSVFGRRASEPLEPGSLLVPGDVTTLLPLPSGDALVGTSLADDQAPTGLVPGDSVIVVVSGQGSSPTSGADSESLESQAPGVLAVGTVYAIVLASDTDSAAASSDDTVTLEGPKTAAALVTAASAASDVSLAEISSPVPS
jgi:hypothetical protein